MGQPTLDEADRALIAYLLERALEQFFPPPMAALAMLDLAPASLRRIR
jgi:hypothetical protein